MLASTLRHRVATAGDERVAGKKLWHAFLDALLEILQRFFSYLADAYCFPYQLFLGIVDDVPLLDLCYEEDSRADVDMNVVMTPAHEFVEIQGTGESATFSQSQLDQLLGLAKKGIQDIFSLQNEISQV